VFLKDVYYVIIRVSEIILRLASVLCFDVADSWLGMTIFFVMAQQPLVSQGLLIIEASRSHSNTPHSLRLLWTREKTDAETSYYTHKRQISMTPAEFEPAIPASDRPKTHALERAANGIRYIILPISSRTDDSQY